METRINWTLESFQVTTDTVMPVKWPTIWNGDFGICCSFASSANSFLLGFSFAPNLFLRFLVPFLSVSLLKCVECRNWYSFTDWSSDETRAEFPNDRHCQKVWSPYANWHVSTVQTCSPAMCTCCWKRHRVRLPRIRVEQITLLPKFWCHAHHLECLTTPRP